MKKTFNVKPPTEIELIFENGENISIIFNARALFHLTNDFENGIKALTDDVSQPEICAKLIYAGSVEQRNDMTLEKAREITCNLDIETINGIILEFQESMGIAKNEMVKEFQKKAMAEFLTNLSKQRT
jgi:hypothetical protein